MIGVQDLAWAPDNLHFASCGADSIINIWNINEHGNIFLIFILILIIVPLKTIDSKANGLTFDPFGKFMAS
jgi:WD40 repeat protein